MSLSFAKAIHPMSDLRTDPDRIMRQLKNSPVIITKKGRPDFGVCDLETLEIAFRIKELKETLRRRKLSSSVSQAAKKVFDELDGKYGL